MISLFLLENSLPLMSSISFFPQSTQRWLNCSSHGKIQHYDNSQHVCPPSCFISIRMRNTNFTKNLSPQPEPLAILDFCPCPSRWRKVNLFVKQSLRHLKDNMKLVTLYCINMWKLIKATTMRIRTITTTTAKSKAWERNSRTRL